MKILPPRLFLLTVVLMTAVHLLLPSAYQLPAIWRWLGLLPLLAGLAVTVAAARHFEHRRTNIKTFDEPTHLVTDGLFRWSRNPMYAGFTAAVAGVAILLGSPAPLVPAAAFAVVCDRWYIRFEERAMRSTFGTAYTEYAGRVRRWL